MPVNFEYIVISEGNEMKSNFELSKYMREVKSAKGGYSVSIE